MEKVQRWRSALTKATGLSGLHYKEGCNESETQFIQRIIREISVTKLNHTQLFVTEHPVGIESRVDAIESLLDMKSNDVRMVGIYGLGGVGKTTIAKAVYNRITNCFELSCFLEDVKEKSSTNDDIIKLQEILLSKILGGTYIKVDSVPEGIIMIKERLCRTRLLLILDNVVESEVMVNLLGECNWLALGSRVIITTRDKQVLNTLGKDRLIYELKELNQSESHELFNLHAFPKIEPEKDYSEVSEKIIRYANGLPLALKIIGSDLCGKSICDWKSALEKYKNIPHKKIVEKLKISYDGLEKTEKDIFLDIACFFKGFNRSYVENILDACKSYPGYGIGKLIDKYLITVGQFGELWTHDLLQQMGREIVQQESEELGERSRIWCFEDAEEILTTNMGSSKIRGIMCCSPQLITMPIGAKAFEKMKNLKFLIVHNVHICEELEYLPNGLTLLQWPEFPFSLPSNYYPRQLVGLEMPCSLIRLETTFKLGIELKYLKYINLEGCDSVTELPKLCTPSLEELLLCDCENLAKVHESLGFLDKLQIWDLTGCRKLQILPNSLNLKSLKRLDLKNCKSITELPELCTPSLEELDLSHCKNLVKVHESVGILDKLRRWELYYCKKLQILPNNLRLKSLEEFDLTICLRLEKFSNIHPEMKCLKSLNLSGSGIRELPSSIEYLTGLELLDLSCCKNLKLRQTNDYLDGFSRCGFLKLESLSFGGNENIIELDFLMKPEYFPVLKILDLCATNIVSIPESLSRFASLEFLSMRDCKQLREISRLPQSVRDVDLSNCYSLNAQSSNRLLNQIVEFLGILPNACKGTRSRILMGIDPQTSSSDILDEIHPHHSPFIVMLPGTEIPKRLKLNHESDGNVISFWVGRKFPNNFFVCFSFGPLKYPWKSLRSVYLSINGCEIEQLFSDSAYELSDHLWIVSFSNERLQNQLNKSKPSERNFVKVICESWRWDERWDGRWDEGSDGFGFVVEDWTWFINHPSRWGVGVECICQWASNNGSQTSMPTANNGSQTTPRTLSVGAQKASKEELRRLLRMASNPIPTPETEFSPNPSNCNAYVQGCISQGFQSPIQWSRSFRLPIAHHQRRQENLD
ncbi:disease resistance protein RUN1-like isoform X4 [Quercus robur]|uniref:disease resistance protein RUN1-like isoform X4 n=1 Tax=Quercus robur TaxID=38942 RepID=UPI00216284E0|nr:disease resistance protein RUN1-like isoform X4 [Quercus robur]